MSQQNVIKSVYGGSINNELISFESVEAASPHIPHSGYCVKGMVTNANYKYVKLLDFVGIILTIFYFILLPTTVQKRVSSFFLSTTDLSSAHL